MVAVRLGWSRRREREPLRLLSAAEDAVRRELAETPRWVVGLWCFTAGVASGIAVITWMVVAWARSAAGGP